mmetsp:Transcript_47491/g.93654  ORF Transcript_47491/g.93654 Transcript_47491/m.93654 type:complete len:80 (+) Transcript_47491:2411-2650(+)
MCAGERGAVTPRTDAGSDCHCMRDEWLHAWSDWIEEKAAGAKERRMVIPKRRGEGPKYVLFCIRLSALSRSRGRSCMRA